MSRSDDQEEINKLVASLRDMEGLIEKAPKPPEKGCPINMEKYDTKQFATASVKALLADSGGSRNRVQRGGPRNRTQRERPATDPSPGDRGDEGDGAGSSRDGSGSDTDVADIAANVQSAAATLVEKKRKLIEDVRDANLHEMAAEEASAKVEEIMASIGFNTVLTEEEQRALQDMTEKMVADHKALMANGKIWIALSLFIHTAGIYALSATGAIDGILTYTGDSYRSMAGMTSLRDSCDQDYFWNIFKWSDDCQQVSQYTTVFWLSVISAIGLCAQHNFPGTISISDTSNPTKVILSLAKAPIVKLASLFSQIESFQQAAADVIKWPFQRIMAVCRWAGRVDPDRRNRNAGQLPSVDLAASRQSPQGSRQPSTQPSPPQSQQASPQNSGDESDSDSSDDESDAEGNEGTSGGRRRKGKRRQTKKRKGRGRKSPTRKRGRKGKGKKKSKAKSKKRKPVKKRSTRKKQRGGGDCPCSASVVNPVPAGGKKKGRGRKSRGKKRSNKRRTYKK